MVRGMVLFVVWVFIGFSTLPLMPHRHYIDHDVSDRLLFISSNVHISSGL